MFFQIFKKKVVFFLKFGKIPPFFIKHKRQILLLEKYRLFLRRQNISKRGLKGQKRKNEQKERKNEQNKRKKENRNQTKNV